MMEQRQFGRTDMKVSVLGFGGAEIGEKGKETSLQEVKQLLTTAIELGLNVIDTASSYNISEELIGQAVSNRRQDYYLFSKCGEGKTVGLEYPDWDPRNVRASAERSLKRLKTDYLDLMLIHSCTEAVLRQGELIEAVEKLKQDGLVRYIGYSGDSTDALYAIKLGVFDALETSLNLLDQESISMTLEEANRRDMGVIIKRPVANVVWSQSDEEESPTPEYIERLKKLNYSFLNENPDKAMEIALRFPLSFPQVHTVIVGTTKVAHFRVNAQYAAKGGLSESEVSLIRKRWNEVREPAWEGLT
jgi:aryl-alcohol dehydrogenase-like predicted oxidoreductase